MAFLGVWVIREGVRGALKKKPSKIEQNGIKNLDTQRNFGRIYINKNSYCDLILLIILYILLRL